MRAIQATRKQARQDKKKETKQQAPISVAWRQQWVKISWYIQAHDLQQLILCPTYMEYPKELGTLRLASQPATRRLLRLTNPICEFHRKQWNNTVSIDRCRSCWPSVLFAFHCNSSCCGRLVLAYGLICFLNCVSGTSCLQHVPCSLCWARMRYEI